MSDSVVVTAERGIVRVELNRPEKLNSVNADVAADLSAACDTIENAADARCVILSGRGRAFCSGANLGSGATITPEVWIRKVSSILQRLDRLPCPLIAAVHGYALGLGGSLALTADFVVATETAVFGFPEVHHGLVPAVTAIGLRRLAAERAVAELLLVGERFSAAQAKAYGLITTVVPDGELSSSVDALAAKLIKGSPLAMRMTKQLLRDLRSANPDDAYRTAESVVLIGRETEDAKEGMAAFREKRKPVWTGR